MYYNPNSLPYNPTAPLRNTIPFIPLEIDTQGVRISNVIPPEYVNKDIRAYVEEVNRSRTPQDVQEMNFIKESLGLAAITKNLMMLGSVLEDDAISLSSDEESQMDEEFRNNVQEVETEEYTPHYPPRTLREIYSLPHKNRGDLKDGLTVSNKEIAEVMNVVHTNELAPEELEKLLTEGATANMSDVRDGRVSER